MTTKELIERLSNLPPDTDVFIYHRYYQYDDPQDSVGLMIEETELVGYVEEEGSPRKHVVLFDVDTVPKANRYGATA